ncbi:MAG: hypothetical protein A2X94_13125 [Bdellovibrionales bacterium GWB1_55_8]|nr:MAG: hypothetical protein A2X94_13125 [Bdellovibrionales bacterium GWB1_55_8]
MQSLIPDFEYRLKLERLKIGSESIEVECLKSLDETIDALFSYLERGGNPALLEELCPYFGVVWPSARALSEFLVEQSDIELKNARVLEVGCGLAIPSMIASRLGAIVTAADFHPEVEKFLSKNLERNRLRNIRYVSLDWTNRAFAEEERYDLVIGSDILYEKTHPVSVARAVSSWVKPHGTVIIADPARPYLQQFVDQMRDLGFSAQTDTRRADGKDIFLLIFRN